MSLCGWQRTGPEYLHSHSLVCVVEKPECLLKTRPPGDPCCWLLLCCLARTKTGTCVNKVCIASLNMSNVAIYIFPSCEVGEYWFKRSQKKEHKQGGLTLYCNEGQAPKTESHSYLLF